MRPESQTSFPESVSSRKSWSQLALLCSRHWIPNSNLSFSAEEQITADIWEHPGEKWGWRGERGERFSNTAFLAFNQVQLHSIHRRWSQDNINKIFNEANYPKSFPKLCLRSQASCSRTLRPRIYSGPARTPPWPVWGETQSPLHCPDSLQWQRSVPLTLFLGLHFS